MKINYKLLLFGCYLLSRYYVGVIIQSAIIWHSPRIHKIKILKFGMLKLTVLDNL